ncbi:MAG: metallophosphoesterase [Spirochaetia bacterium]|nr:metallophosphoesterase [Spirochaetia bacterium]
MKRKIIGVIIFYISSLCCSSENENRYELDLLVGNAEIPEASVSVSNGLAVVQAFENGKLKLYSSAPDYQFELVLKQGSAFLWNIEISNVIKNSILTAFNDKNKSLAVNYEDEILPDKVKYSVETADLNKISFSLSAPNSKEMTTFKIALVSDIQDAVDKIQDIFLLMNNNESLDFVISAGDLTSQGSVEELEFFQGELNKLNIPFYSTLGNHETFNDFTAYTNIFGRGSFQFLYKGVYFTFADSSRAGIEPVVYDWLAGWLEDSKDSTNIFITHYPPFDPSGIRNGSFASRIEASKLLNMLSEYNVDLTLYGHIHSYYEFTNAGIPAYISGGGGAIPQKFDGINRHFLILELDASYGVKNVEVVRVD